LSIPTVVWELGGTGTAVSPAIVTGVLVGGTKTYKAKAKIGNCISASSLSLMVKVVENATVSIASNKTTGCEEDKVVFTATTSHADAPVSYDWYLDDFIQIATTTTNSYTVNLADANASYSVKIVNNSTCIGAVSSNSIAINVTKLPTPKLSSLSEELCSTDGGYDLVAKDENGNLYPSVEWEDGSGTRLLGTSSTYHVTTTGTYSVYVTKNGCRSKERLDATVANITVQSLSVELDPSETQDVEEGETLDLYADVTGVINPLEYQWYGTVRGPWTGTDAVYTYNADSTESVSVVVVDTKTGCKATSNVTLINVLKNFIVPNAFTPNGDGINDTWNISGLETYRNAVMNVYNRWGQLVYTNHGSYSSPWDGRRNGKDLPIGTYYYVVTLNQDGKANISGDVTLVR
jgi:gliding motility-associated-like protein